MTAGPVTYPVLIVFYGRIYVCSFQALPLLLYGCESCLLTLRQYHTLRVFKNRVLRRVFWSKSQEVTGEWREMICMQFHNCILHQLLSWLSERGWLDVHVWEEIRNVFKISVGKLKGKYKLEDLGIDGRTV